MTDLEKQQKIEDLKERIIAVRAKKVQDKLSKLPMKTAMEFINAESNPFATLFPGVAMSDVGSMLGVESGTSKASNLMFDMLKGLPAGDLAGKVSEKTGSTVLGTSAGLTRALVPENYTEAALALAGPGLSKLGSIMAKKAFNIAESSTLKTISKFSKVPVEILEDYV